MKGIPQEVPVPQQQEAEEPPRRLRERYEVEASDMTPELMERIVERLEPGDHVFFMKDGRRLAELNWTMHIDPPTEEELAAAKKRLRNSKGNPQGLPEDHDQGRDLWLTGPRAIGPSGSSELTPTSLSIRCCMRATIPLLAL